MISVLNNMCGDGPWAQTCTVRPQLLTYPGVPLTPRISEWGRLGHWLLAVLPEGLKNLVEAFSSCLSSWASRTEHSCQVSSRPAQSALIRDAAASSVSAGFAYVAPSSISFSLFPYCFKSVRLQGIVLPAHCLINATKCLKCLKLLCMKENMGLSEKGKIKSPYSEL